MPFPTDPELTQFGADLNTLYKTKGVPPRPERAGYHVDDLGNARWAGEYMDRRVHRGESHAQAWGAIEQTILRIWYPTEPPVPTPGGALAPIAGFLRVNGASFGDDSGPRSVRFCSSFPALNDFRVRRDKCLRDLDAMMGRWHGGRTFWHLADPWETFGKDVRPTAWSDFDEVFVGYLRACWERNLRVSLTAGDLQYLTVAKPPLYRRIAQLCASVNQQVVAITGMVNEARVNASEGEDWNYWAMLSREFQSIYPWGVHGLSDHGPDPEEPANLRASSIAPATHTLVHGTRETPLDAIRRAFNVKFEGTPDLCLNQDEPSGLRFGGTGSHNIRVYQPLSTRQELFGLYSMIVLTGQVLTYFDDLGLTNTENHPIDSGWGFKELPELWKQMNVPDDIGRYRLIPGHKAEAPITIEGIPGPAEGRCDNMVGPDGSRGYAVIYGETATTAGTWKIRSRTGVMPDSGIWGADGLMLNFNGSADVPSANQVCVVEWHR